MCVAQLLNVFLPLNDYLLYLNISFLTLFFFFKRKFLNQIKIDKIVFIVALLISLTNIFGSNFSDDLNHYHYSFISNTDVTNYIWGLKHFHPLYGTSPIWLTGHSYFNFDSSRLQDIHVLNGLILFLFLGIFLSQFNSEKKLKFFFQPILFSLVVFVLLKYTRLKEFGIDRPAYLIFFVSIYYYFKYLHTNKKEINSHFLIFSIMIFSVFFIKVIFIFLLLIPLTYFYRNYKIIDIYEKRFSLILIFLLSYFVKNILISGCLIYPISSTCISYLPWFDGNIIKQFSISSEIFNKSYPSYQGLLSENEYIKNFNWIFTWFIRAKVELFEFIFTILLVIILTFVSFRFKKDQKKISSNLLNLNHTLLLILFLSSLVFVLKNPNIRMNHHIFIIFMILFFSYLMNFGKFFLNKKMFMSFILLSLFFNFSKNLQRIHDINYQNDLTSNLTHKIYKSKKHNIGNFQYYVGWYGKGPLSTSELKGKTYKKKLIFDIIF